MFCYIDLRDRGITSHNYFEMCMLQRAYSAQYKQRKCFLIEEVSLEMKSMKARNSGIEESPDF